MINILIIDNNPITIHNSIDTFINSNISFCFSVTNNKEELIKIISTEKINYILLNLDIQKNINFDILEYIEFQKMIRYYNSIILISNQNNYNIDKKYEPYILNTVLENPILDCKTLNIEPNNLKKLIYSELRHLHYNLSYCGTHYIADIIIELFNRKKSYAINLEKEVYPILSKKYHKSICNIKNNISQANKIMYYDCKEEIIKEYFHSTNKPKTKEIVYVILDKISQKN